MKYVAEVVSHITVEAQNREQAEFRVGTVLSKMQSLFEDGEVVFHTNSINKKHYRHMPHYFQSPTHGDLRHQHINVSRLKPGCVFAFWNRTTDSLLLFKMGYAGSWTVEKWEKSGGSYVITKSKADNDTVLKLVDASNDHDPSAVGYVVGMEHVASKREIMSVHENDIWIGYKERIDHHE